jgi:hypothetical protein
MALDDYGTVGHTATSAHCIFLLLLVLRYEGRFSLAASRTPELGPQQANVPVNVGLRLYVAMLLYST